MRFMAWLVIHSVYRLEKKGSTVFPSRPPPSSCAITSPFIDAGALRSVPAADTVGDGPQHFPGPAVELFLPHRATIPIASSRENAEGAAACLRGHRRCPRTWRARGHLPGRPARRWRYRRVPRRRKENRRAHARSGDPDGAVRIVAQPVCTQSGQASSTRRSSFRESAWQPVRRSLLRPRNPRFCAPQFRRFAEQVAMWFPGLIIGALLGGTIAGIVRWDGAWLLFAALGAIAGLVLRNRGMVAITPNFTFQLESRLVAIERGWNSSSSAASSASLPQPRLPRQNANRSEQDEATIFTNARKHLRSRRRCLRTTTRPAPQRTLHSNPYSRTSRAGCGRSFRRQHPRESRCRAAVLWHRLGAQAGRRLRPVPPSVRLLTATVAGLAMIFFGYSRVVNSCAYSRLAVQGAVSACSTWSPISPWPGMTISAPRRLSCCLPSWASRASSRPCISKASRSRFSGSRALFSRRFSLRPRSG